MSQPQFDDKDNQRGGNDAVVADLIESEHFPKLDCMTQLGNHVLSNNLIYSRFWPASYWCFFYPPHQRAHGILYIQLPRDMDPTHNLDEEAFHIVTVKFL